MNTTQYTFKEWLLINPADADNDETCVFCKGKRGKYTDEGIAWKDCVYCNGTGKQAVADAYEVYLTQALRDAKAIYDYETADKRREYRDKKTRLRFEIDAMRRAKRGVTS